MDFNKQIQKMWDDMSDRGQKDLVRNAVRVFVADKMGSFLLKNAKTPPTTNPLGIPQVNLSFHGWQGFTKGRASCASSLQTGEGLQARPVFHGP